MAAIGGDLAWHVEYDPAPSRILEHRWPGVPNRPGPPTAGPVLATWRCLICEATGRAPDPGQGFTSHWRREHMREEVET